jgi:hypothetical protein
MKIEGKGLEVMDFTFHPRCASDVGSVLAHVGKYRQWRTSHPTRLPELVK